MIKWLAIPAMAFGAALLPKKKLTDQKKIQLIFENRKVGINKCENFLHPKLVRKYNHTTYTTYIYSLPLGVPSEAFESFIPVLKDGINKNEVIICPINARKKSKKLFKDIFHMLLEFIHCVMFNFFTNM
ncbi:hypothetical protein [Peribacillus sp. NPDC097895]|uniref:hypothetical protein n=1 Tax=Peribacillus sp. NPDC097895 TaxID=3390619 RepID=UPI003CFE573F